MSNLSFPVLELNGSPEEIGLNHGRFLKKKITSLINLYKPVWPALPRVLTMAACFQKQITAFEPRYAREIESLARGADQDPLLIYALNARSELMLTAAAGHECTTLALPGYNLLGQNWDWAVELQSLATLLKVTPDHGPAFITLTEPGIIGKIGLNQAGIGVCLNFLKKDGVKPRGLPLHILMRYILESRDLKQTVTTILKIKPSVCGHLLSADAQGQAFGIELDGNKTRLLTTADFPADYLLHTNHYLTETNPAPNTRQRFKTGTTLLKPPLRPEMITDLLQDQSSVTYPILRPFKKSSRWKKSGTVSTVIMDLAGRRLSYNQGLTNTAFKEICL